MKEYIVNDFDKIVGEAKNYDSHSKKGLLKLYHVGDGDEFCESTLDEDYKVIAEQLVEKDEKLCKSLAEAKYQTWRYHNRGLLQTDYERIRRHLVDYDQFCRNYYFAMHKGELARYLTEEFAEGMKYFEKAFCIDAHREPAKSQGD